MTADAPNSPEILKFPPERRRRLYFGIFRWEGFLYPEFYVRDDAGRGLKALRDMILIVTAPM